MVTFLRGLRDVFRALLSCQSDVERSGRPWRILCTEADHRAQRLLVKALSAEQRAQYLATGHFDVVGCDTGGRYRILRGSQMNVERLDRAGRRVELLCFVPKTRVPTADVMLAQKFALELFERDALKIAYRCPRSDNRA